MNKLPVRYVCLLVVVFAAVLFIRLFGASDLHQNEDQTRTLSFTADMVLNRNFILPRDAAGEITRKPPLVNWVGMVLPALGCWTEWALKLPSILGASIAVVFSVFMAQRMIRSLKPEIDPMLFGTATGLVYIASASTVKHMYFLRPDMLNTALLAGAWVFGTLALEETASRRAWKAVAFWIFVGLAALAKGPTALIPVLYVLLGGRLMHGRWTAVNRTGWWWGFPVAAVIFLSWFVSAWRLDPGYVGGTLVGTEVVERIGTDPWYVCLLKCLASSWKIPHWFIERFFPWSLPALAALFVVRPGTWRTHAFAPAALWMLVVLLFFVPLEHRGGSFFMPAEPAAASLAVFFLCEGTRRFRMRPAAVAAAAVVLAMAFVIPKAFFGEDARRGVGDEIKRFAREAARITGDETVVFLNVGLNPVSVLMGRFQAGEPLPDQIAGARWAVKGCGDGELDRIVERRKPVLVSKRMERDADKGQGLYLCLIRIKAEKP
jgi:4-amino-4-deoxy-L-arabinose transferase-like glycosyltransferase